MTVTNVIDAIVGISIVGAAALMCYTLYKINIDGGMLDEAEEGEELWQNKRNVTDAASMKWTNI